jgi:hypothetical protein
MISYNNKTPKINAIPTDISGNNKRITLPTRDTFDGIPGLWRDSARHCSDAGLRILVVNVVDGAVFRHKNRASEIPETLAILMVDLKGIEPLTS